jgi:hypothetical protein
VTPRFYVKSIIAVIVAVLSAVPAVMADDVITNSEWINVALLTVNAAMVFAAPNVPGAKYTKAILSLLVTLLTVATSVLTNYTVSYEELAQILLALAATAGVFGFKNAVPTNEQLADLRRERGLGRHSRVEDA